MSLISILEFENCLPENWVSLRLGKIPTPKITKIPKNYERMKFKQRWTSNVTLLMLLKIIALGMHNEKFK